MAHEVDVRGLQKLDEREVQALSDVLIDCVEGGASVSFMLPMSRAKALTYWREVAASAARCERIVLAAYDAAETIVGTVQVVFAQPENQPHRADIAKMLVHRRARRHGVGAALLRSSGASRAQVRQDDARARHSFLGRGAAVRPAGLAPVRREFRTTRSCRTARPARLLSTTNHCAAREARRRPRTPRSPRAACERHANSEGEQQQKISDHAGDETAGRRAVDGAGNEQVADETDGIEIRREITA